MKTDSALTRLSRIKEECHDYDVKLMPDRHFLNKDIYSKQEMLFEMCLMCADHYECNKNM